MTTLQAFDLFARIAKQRMPMNHRLQEWREQPAIFGGGSKLTVLASVSYVSGDWTHWPVTGQVHTLGQNPCEVDPAEWALEHHYNGNARRQAKAVDPRLDRNVKQSEEAWAVHAVVEKALKDLCCPEDVLRAILKRHPRDPHDKLNEGRADFEGRIVAKWVQANEDALHLALGTVPRSNGKKKTVPKPENLNQEANLSPKFGV